jgi:hypothetical protein
MIIKIDNNTIEIEPELLSVSHQPINVFSTENDNLFVASKISEYKNIKINLKITLKNEIWNVPYLIQLKKDLKENFVEKYSDTFIELSTLYNKKVNNNFFTSYFIETYKPSEIDIFDYSKTRYLNKPYFEIFENKFNELIFKLLNYIYTLDNLSIKKEEYENINKSTFFNFSTEEIECLQTKENFVIREYRLKDLFVEDVDTLNKYYKVKWQIPLLNFKELKLNSAKVSCIEDVQNDNVWSYELIENEGSLKIILPQKYYSKYRPNFEEINYDYYESTKYPFNDFRGANIFYGTYDECYQKLNNRKEFYKLELDLLKEREESKQQALENSDLDEERLKRSRRHY